MVKASYQVVWTTRSQQQMKQVYDHISRDSLQNAEKVTKAIVSAMEKAVKNPEYFNADKYKKNNDGSYRAFEKNRYRVSYRFTKNIIRVLRVRHTSMRPKHY